jgi:hypothetical protein
MQAKQSGNFHHLFISKAYKRYHRGKLKRDGDSFIEKIKLTNLGCPPSSHVIDRKTDTMVVYG